MRTTLNYEYYRRRLANQILLRRAIKVKVTKGVYDLAVPCGYKRKGGWVTCNERSLAEDALKILAKKKGFPNLRIEKVDRCFLVWWGSEPPNDDGIEDGKFYGYKMKEIRGYMNGEPQ